MKEAHEQINGGFQGPGQVPWRLPGSWTRAPGSTKEKVLTNSRRFSQSCINKHCFLMPVSSNNAILAILAESRNAALLIAFSQKHILADSRNHVKHTLMVDDPTATHKVLADSRRFSHLATSPIFLQILATMFLFPKYCLIQ